MYVIKRNGEKQLVDVVKITHRLQNIYNHIQKDSTSGEDASQSAGVKSVDIKALVHEISLALHDGITTTELDTLAASLAQPLAFENPDYGRLAAYILVSNHHKNIMYRLWINFRHRNSALTLEDIKSRLYYWVRLALVENINEIGGHAPLIAPELVAAEVDESAINYEADYQYNYAGFKLLERSYLMSASLLDVNGKACRHVVECPQHLLMRVALAIHCGQRVASYASVAGELDAGEAKTKADADNVGAKSNGGDVGDIHLDAPNMARALESYNMMSKLLFTHATPTLFNAGTLRQQCSSCFLLQPPADSLLGIGAWWNECAQISKLAGGIGSHATNLRSQGAYISGTNGHSNGLVPWLRCVNVLSESVDQGGGKRPGTHVVYLEPWHADVLGFLDMRKPRGTEQTRGKHLFYAMWISDEFMERIRTNQPWYLMCPYSCPGLAETYGAEHSALYNKYVAEGKYKRVMPAQELWINILECIPELGMPYIMFKDNINYKTNHQHLGTIKSSNLCAEICEYSSPTETAVCNLASIGLAKFVTVIDSSITYDSADVDASTNELTGIAFVDALTNVVNKLAARFDFALLDRVVRILVRNLDRVIDINYYPSRKSMVSNLRHRPMGIGVQGLADVYTLLGIAYDSQVAKALQARIFEQIYYSALSASCDLAVEYGKYATYEGSPASRGLLQMDMWDERGHKLAYPLRLDWAALRLKIAQHGLRNSLLTTCMPTASTSTIMGMSPCIEPHNALVYKRNDRNGETLNFNEIFVRHMIRLGLWTPELRTAVVMSRTGGIADCDWLPIDIRQLYKTVWDIKPTSIINAALVRGQFIDQSQSMNLFIATPAIRELNQLYFYSWERGLKTGSYYVHRIPAVDAQKIQAGYAAEQVSKMPPNLGVVGEVPANMGVGADPKPTDGEFCTMKEGCLSCGS